MILYRKTFPLGEGISFSDYIKALNETTFPPYTLLIKRIPSTPNYHIEIALASPMSVFVPFFFGGVLFNECVIKYNRTPKEFTLNASVGTLNFLLTVFIGLMALCLIVLSVTVELSVEDLFALLLISIAILAPYVSIYFRETKLLRNIGLIAMEQI